MTTPEEYLADERRLDWQEQQAEMQREREEKILEDLGHIEAAGMLEEAATLRDGLGWPGASRPIRPFDDGEPA